MKNKYKKIIASFAFLGLLLMMGCGKQGDAVASTSAEQTATIQDQSSSESSIEEQGISEAQENNTKPEENTAVTDGEPTETDGVPSEYAAMVVVSINPMFQLYLDADNVVLACIGVNEDAKQVLDSNPDKFQGVKLEEAVESIVEDSIEQGYLSEEKGNDVNITVSRVRDEEYAVEEHLSEAQKAAETVMTEKEISSEVTISIEENAFSEETEVQATSDSETEVVEDAGTADSEEAKEKDTVDSKTEAVEEKETTESKTEVVNDTTETGEKSSEVEKVSASDVCPDCGGTGFTCPNCGKHAWESCYCCKGTGYQTCTNCKGSKLQRCPGCKGSGSDEFGNTCTYCNGSGKSTCEVCNGAGGYTCSRCYGFTYACSDCEYAVEYCKTCH